VSTDVTGKFVATVITDFKRHADKYDDAYASRLAAVLAEQ